MEGVWIGTSGWSYKGWGESFYPKTSAAQQLPYYATQFPSVEINATFYRLPTTQMVEGWHDKVPEGFLFAVKGSRYLTHSKKLVDVEAGLEKYVERIEPLGKHTGPILWQLPPFLQKDVTRLDAFLRQTPRSFRHAIEFRHPSWLDDEVFEVLRRYKAACVWISSLRMPTDFTMTGDFVYARFHGLAGGAAHDYTEAELEPWAQQFSQAARDNKPAFAYFNNDVNTRAPLNARTLMRLVGRGAVQPFSRVPETKRHQRSVVTA